MLALDLFPKIDFPAVIITTMIIVMTKTIITTMSIIMTKTIITTKMTMIITTKLIGASPRIMEVDVTGTIEEAVNTMNVR
jgi:multidrug efflux pump subunit AcrB